MWSGHPLKIALLLASSGLLAGCAQPGPFLSGRTTIGTLKASVSHLEHENQQLRTKVDTLEAENREFENRLVQEESVNWDLSARLDDAKDLLRRRGTDLDERHASTPPRNEPGVPAESVPAVPAGRPGRPRRKPPFAQIPNRIDNASPDETEDPGEKEPPDTSQSRSHDAFGPQGRLDDTNSWLPVARGTSRSSSQVR